MSTLHDFIYCCASIETLHWRTMQCFNGGMTIGNIMKCPLDLPSLWPHPQLVVNQFTCKFVFNCKPSQVNLCTYVCAPLFMHLCEFVPIYLWICPCLHSCARSWHHHLFFFKVFFIVVSLDILLQWTDWHAMELLCDGSSTKFYLCMVVYHC